METTKPTIILKADPYVCVPSFFHTGGFSILDREEILYSEAGSANR